MAYNIRLNRNVNGAKTVLYPETVIGQVKDLSDALDAKVPTTRKINSKALSADVTLSASDVGAPTVSEMNLAVAAGQVVRESIIAADLSGQDDWDAEDVYLVGNDTTGYNRYEFVWEDSDKTEGEWKNLGKAGDVNLSGYVPTTRKINSKALSADVTLSAFDVGAATASDVTAAVADRPKVFYGTSQPAAWASDDYWIEQLA